MNNLMISVKRFFGNKNAITIIGVLVILGLLYFAYSKTVNDAVNPVTVPVAASTIQPRTEITEEMITTIEVPSIVVSENVHLYEDDLIGKYTNVNSVIPEGSMFYYQTVISKEELPDSSIVEVGEGKVPYLFSVDLETSFINSIYPGNKIDMYMKAEDESGKVMIGKLISNLEVFAVKDSSGKDVFENTEEEREASYFVFGLDEEIHLLFRKAAYISGVELIPVPLGGNVSTDADTTVSTEYLRNYINANTIMLEGQDETKDTNDTETGE